MRRLGKASRLLREHDRQGGKNWGKTGEKLGTPHPFTEFEILPKPAHSYIMGRIGRVVAVGEAHHTTASRSSLSFIPNQPAVLIYICWANRPLVTNSGFLATV